MRHPQRSSPSASTRLPSKAAWLSTLSGKPERYCPDNTCSNVINDCQSHLFALVGRP